MKLFNKNLFILSLVLGACIAAVTFGSNVIEHTTWTWIGFGYFILLSWVSYSFIIKAIKMDHNRFVSRFLFLTTARIILTAIFLAIYLIISPQRDPSFIVLFMLLYLFYTLFEIYHLVTKLRAEKYESVEDTNS